MRIIFHGLNTLQAIRAALGTEAEILEMDLQNTADGRYVIFHDANLLPRAGVDEAVADISYERFRSVLAEAGHDPALTLDKLTAEYHGDKPILFDIRSRTSPQFAAVGNALPFEVYFGVRALPITVAAREVTPSDHILAFLPAPEDTADFVKAGAGIIRLWEEWLDGSAEALIKRAHDLGADVWIMCRGPKCGETSPDRLDRFRALGVDGVLVDYPEVVADWLKKSKA